METIQEVTLRGRQESAPRHRTTSPRATVDPTPSLRMSILVTQSLARSSMLVQPKQVACFRCHRNHIGPCPSQQRPQSVFTQSSSFSDDDDDDDAWWRAPRDGARTGRYSLDSFAALSSSGVLSGNMFEPFHEFKKRKQATAKSMTTIEEEDGGGGGKMGLEKLEEGGLGTREGQQQQQDVLHPSNVDSGYAWVVLVVLFMIQATTMGPVRPYSLIYDKLARDGHMTREEAIRPFTIMGVVEAMTGPVCGCVLAITGSWRLTVIIGSLLVSLAHLFAGWCAESQPAQILFMGLICGFGQSFIAISFFQVNNAYFDQYRNFAFGVIGAGCAIGALALSPLCEYLLANFAGSRVCYLVLGLLMVPNVFLALMLRPQTTSDTTQEQPTTSISRQTSQESQESVRITTKSASSPPQPQSTPPSSESKSPSPTILPPTPAQSPSPSPDGGKNSEKQQAAAAAAEEEVPQQQQLQPPAVQRRVQIQSIPEVIEEESSNRNSTSDSSCCQDEQEDGLDNTTNANVSPWIWLKLVMTNPYFHLIWLTQLLFCYLNFVFGMICVDFAKDRNMDTDSVSRLVPCWTIGQLFGRLFLSMLVDLKLISHKSFTILCFAAIGATTLVLNNMQFNNQDGGWLYNIIIQSPFFVLSMLISLLYILLVGLVVHYVEPPLQPISLGISSFMGSFFLIPRGLLIGRFRDTMGNYDMLITVFAYVSIGAALIWLILPPSFWYINCCFTKLVGLIRRPQKVQNSKDVEGISAMSGGANINNNNNNNSEELSSTANLVK